MAARLSASVTTSQRQSCSLLAVGACIASCTHSRMTSRPTGRVRSRRLRTARVVVSSSSTEEMSTRRSDVDRAGLVDTEHGQRPTQTQENGDAQREVEDLRVGEQPAQALEKPIVDGGRLVGEALGVLDGYALPRGVAGVGGVRRDILVEVRGDARVEHRRRPKAQHAEAGVVWGM